MPDRPQLLRILRRTGAVLAVLLAGGFGLGLLFLDFGVSSTPWQRAVAAALFFFLTGLVIGLVVSRPRAWFYAALAAWATTLLGTIGLAVSIGRPDSADLPLTALLLLGPLTFSLAGVGVVRVVRCWTRSSTNR